MQLKHQFSYRSCDSLLYKSLTRLILWIFVVLGAMSLLLLAGCSSDTREQRNVDDYLWRLANVLDQPTPEFMPGVIQYPAKRDMDLEFPAHSIDLLDFLSMTGCKLQITAAQKNSVLGRVMTNSQSFLYHWQFIQESAECVDYLATRQPNLAEQLRHVVDQKIENMPLHFWLALWAGPEVRNYFGASQQWLSSGQQVGLSGDTFHTLKTINRYAHGVVNQESSEISVENYREGFERSLATFNHSQTGGQMLITFVDVIERLNAGTAMLQSQFAQALCVDGRHHKNVAVLHTVFMKFYIGQVQPYLAWLDREGDILLGQLEAASINRHDNEEQWHALPKAYQMFWLSYLDQEYSDGVWQRYQMALTRHTQAWQAILKVCDLMPSR